MDSGAEKQFYQDKSSGEMKPGTKGISLSVEQVSDGSVALTAGLRRSGAS